MERFTYRVTLAYHGPAFHGFARQPGLQTVESTVVACLEPLVPGLAGLSSGGRTDRGVSATGQVISFWSRVPLDPREIEQAIDQARPGELAALDVRWVPRCFHAQHSAVLRRYVYLLDDGGTFEVARLDRMLSALVGRRSFAAFSRDTPEGRSLERRLVVAGARRTSAREVRFDFAADGFLRRQVRVLVSTALREAEAGAPDDVLVSIAASEDRAATALPAPAERLFLTRVEYDAASARSRSGHLEQAPVLRR